MNNYLSIIGWYLKRPGLYPVLWRLIKSKLNARVDRSESPEEARHWCEDRAITTQNAIYIITGTGSTIPVREVYKTIFSKAEEIVRECPIALGGPGNLDLLYWISDFIKAQKVIETGVAYGWSSLAILLSLTSRIGSLLISTDMPYRGIDKEKQNLSSDPYVGCVVPSEYKMQWQILHQADREALPKALKRMRQIDLCHYDSDKSYEGRMWAYPLLWNALRPGGFFISDDIGDNLAFRDFLQRLSKKALIVRSNNDSMKTPYNGIKYIGVIIKENNDPKL